LPGHSYIKRLFIDRDFTENENPKDYKFIQALVYDNDYIMKNDPGYVKSLERLPEDRRRAMLYGEWDVFTGQMFKEFKRDLHVIKPFKIPNNWKRIRMLDYGLDMLAGLWMAIDEDGFMYVYREFNEEDLIVSHAAQRIVEHTDTSEAISYTVVPPDVFRKRQQQTGETTAEIMIKSGLTGLVEADNSRVDGWRNIRELLQPITNRWGNMQPRLQIFDTCKTLIKNFPLLQASEKNPDDADKEPHDITHNMDALRYGVMSRPGTANGVEKKLKYPEFEEFDDYAGMGDGFY